jgi:hypothetical protein
MNIKLGRMWKKKRFVGYFGDLSGVTEENHENDPTLAGLRADI